MSAYAMCMHIGWLLGFSTRVLYELLYTIPCIHLYSNVSRLFLQSSLHQSVMEFSTPFTFMSLGC